MSALRDWAKLDARWYEDAVLRAAAKDAAGAFVMWPVLVAMAKGASHVDDNPAGVVRITLDDLARACCLTKRRAEPAVQALRDGGFITLDDDGRGLFAITLTTFGKWQSPRKSKAERSANHRWSTSRGKASTRDGGETVASRSRDGRVMPDRDVDGDGDETPPPVVGGDAQHGHQTFVAEVFDADSAPPLPPSPDTFQARVRRAQRDLGSLAHLVVNMISLRNSDAGRLLNAEQEFKAYWHPACELLAEHGEDRLRDAFGIAAENNATRIQYVATTVARLHRDSLSELATSGATGSSEYANLGIRATAPDHHETGAA